MKRNQSVANVLPLAFILLLASFPNQFVLAHPTYARNKPLMCETMMPSHGATAQNSTSFGDFYTLSAKKDSTGTYHVQIDALDKDFGIRGYLISARDACTGKILSGNWTSAQADQILPCSTDNKGVNSVHHRPRRSPPVTQVKHDWVPITDASSLKFMATVIQTKDTFWVKESATVAECKN